MGKGLRSVDFDRAGGSGGGVSITGVENPDFSTVVRRCFLPVLLLLLVTDSLSGGLAVLAYGALLAFEVRLLQRCPRNRSSSSWPPLILGTDGS